MDVLHALGIAFVTLTVAAVTFIVALQFMDNRRWWRGAGLAMFACATVAALIAAAIAVWALT